MAGGEQRPAGAAAESGGGGRPKVASPDERHPLCPPTARWEGGKEGLPDLRWPQEPVAAATSISVGHGKLFLSLRSSGSVCT